MDPDPDEHIHPGKEDLHWGAGAEEVIGSVPSAKYNKLSEQARRMIADESLCSMFCGGKKCKYCTHDNWTPEQMAINGLYSAWVTDNILAMARPSNYGLDNFSILEQFEKKGIKTVINLQQPGEHAFCGHGNDSSGFSYNPQRLMERNIYFYNFAWQDYGIAPMSTLLDIVKVMQFGVSEGKVAVHCHAGLGRTGLLIACYLVFCNRVSAGDAVHYVRSRRPGAIQTSQQVQTVYDFETHLKPFRTIFPSRIPRESEVSFKHFLNRQTHMLHGFEARRLRFIPKVIYICCERLLELAERGEALKKIRTYPSSSTGNAKAVSSGLSHMSARSENNLLAVDQISNVRSRSCDDLPNMKFKKALMEDQTDNSSTDLSVQCDGESGIVPDEDKESCAAKSDSGKNPHCDEEEEEEEDDDDCIVFGRTDVPPTKAHSQTPLSFDVESSVDRRVKAGSPVSHEDKTRAEVPLREDTSPQQVQNSHPVQKSDSSPSQAVPESEASAKGGKTKRFKKKPMTERLKCWASKCTSPETSKGEDSRTELVLEPEKGKVCVLCQEVCTSLAAIEYASDVRKKADHLETELNVTDEAWSSLAYEKDSRVLSAIVWDWLDQLKEPVLRRQDLVHLLEKSDTPSVLLKHLERPIKHFIEYLAVVVSKLFPQSEELKTRLVERLLSHLTHQVVTLNITSFTANPYQPVHWGEMRSSDASRLVQFFFNLIAELGKANRR